MRTSRRHIMLQLEHLYNRYNIQTHLEGHNPGDGKHYHLETKDGGRDLIVGTLKEVQCFVDGMMELTYRMEGA